MTNTSNWLGYRRKVLLDAQPVLLNWPSFPALFQVGFSSPLKQNL